MNTLTRTPSDLIRFLRTQNERLTLQLNTLRGQHQSSMRKLEELEAKIKELQDLRELDRAKLTQLSVQILDVTSSQVEVLTGGLRGPAPEPAEALATLAGHAGLAILRPIGRNIAAIISLLLFGGIVAVPVIERIPAPLLGGEVHSLDRNR